MSVNGRASAQLIDSSTGAGRLATARTRRLRYIRYYGPVKLPA